MAIIRLQDKTPTVYTWESRDFQLIARLFDCVFNGVKYDIDTMLDVLDASKCRANILQLVQTKLGFFTWRDVEDDTLRCILQAFPLMVRAKGSLKAVQEAINVFLKAYSITTEINVWYVTDSAVVYNTEVSDHTIIIGLNKALANMYVLEEIFRYILPTGFGFYLYFYNTIDEIQTFAMKTNAKLLYASDNINSMVRGWEVDERELPGDFLNRTLGAFDVTELASTDSMIETQHGTYEPGDESKFLGILIEQPSVSPSMGDVSYIKLIDSKNYEIWYRYNGNWKKIDYKGACSKNPALVDGVSWTIIDKLFETSSFNENVTIDIDQTLYLDKFGRVSKTFKYNKKKGKWECGSEEVNIEECGILINLHGEILTGSETIVVMKNITENSVITSNALSNHYIWFSGLSKPLNKKCLYDLYLTINGEE